MDDDPLNPLQRVADLIHPANTASTLHHDALSTSHPGNVQAINDSSPNAARLSQLQEGNGDSSPRPRNNLTFPFAAQPDIIRSHQKDVYYQSVLSDQINTVIRQYAGTRVLQQRQAQVDTLSSFAYHALTTMLGSQTLGEEYCEIIQVDKNQQYPSTSRRTALVFVHSVVPYLLSWHYARFRKRLRDNARQRKQNTRLQKMTNTLVRALPTYDTLVGDYMRSVHLASFYLFGRYYDFAKRATGVRYIFTRRLQEGESRPGYEVLGVLLILQLAIRMVTNWRADKDEEEDEEEEIDQDLSAAASKQKQTDYSLVDVSQLTEQQQDHRKCTLCLTTPWTNPTATDCGHVFCWDCIVGWCTGNRPECPLCRSSINISHLLPLYNF